jgi:hypothetical protein
MQLPKFGNDLADAVFDLEKCVLRQGEVEGAAIHLNQVLGCRQGLGDGVLIGHAAVKPMQG